MTTIDPSVPPACRPSDAYLAGELLRQLTRDLWALTPGMRAAGTRYLPLHEGEVESSQEYKRRLASSFLYPAHPRAVRNLVGKVFAKPVLLGEDVPGAKRRKPGTDIVAWCEDVDRRGNNLHNFARTLFTDVWLDGVGFVLVDYTPGATATGSRADDAAAGRRPWLVRYKAGELIRWRSEVIGGVQRLTMACLREAATVPDGDYGEVSVERVRAFLLVDGVVQYESWEKRSGEKWAIAEERRPIVVGGATAAEIPLVAVYADPEHVGQWGAAEPPLQDLAWLNVRDWQKMSDLDAIEHTANVPVTFFAGMTKDDVVSIPWGPSVAVIAQNPEAKAVYVEHTGKAIGELKSSIADNRELMRLLSLEPLVPRSGDVTATGEALRGAEAHSQLLAAALGLQDGLEQCLRWMARYARLGDDAGGSVVVNTKFSLTTAQVADVAAINQMRADREITRETRWKEMQRREVLGDDFDPEAEAEALEQEASTELALAGQGRAIAARVAELVAGGMDPQEAIAQAEAETGDELDIDDDQAA